MAEGGGVTIEHLPGQASYTGSVANGVTGVSLGAWPGSFQIIGADPGGGAAGVALVGGGSWTSVASPGDERGSKFLYICPGGARLGTVYGTNTYTDDSSVCTAAVQVGLLTTAGSGGRATIVIEPGQSGISELHCERRHDEEDSGPALGSFAFAGAAAIPGSQGAGGATGAVARPAADRDDHGHGARQRPPVHERNDQVRSDCRPDARQRSLKGTTGSVKLTGAGGVTAAFVLARGTVNKKPVVVLKLAKGDFSACPKRRRTARPRAGRQGRPAALGERGRKFQTRGRYAAATVRGPIGSQPTGATARSRRSSGGSSRSTTCPSTRR